MPVPIYEDNQSAIELLKNFWNNSRCKHITVKLDSILDWCEKKWIELKFVMEFIEIRISRSIPFFFDNKKSTISVRYISNSLHTEHFFRLINIKFV